MHCGVEQRALPIFGRAAITLGIGPHSSFWMDWLKMLRLKFGKWVHCGPEKIQRSTLYWLPSCWHRGRSGDNDAVSGVYTLLSAFLLTQRQEWCWICWTRCHDTSLSLKWAVSDVLLRWSTNCCQRESTQTTRNKSTTCPHRRSTVVRAGKICFFFCVHILLVVLADHDNGLADLLCCLCVMLVYCGNCIKRSTNKVS